MITLSGVKVAEAFQKLIDAAVYRTVTHIDVEVRLIARGPDGEVVAEQEAPTVYKVAVNALPVTITPTMNSPY